MKDCSNKPKLMNSFNEVLSMLSFIVFFWIYIKNGNSYLSMTVLIILLVSPFILNKYYNRWETARCKRSK